MSLGEYIKSLRRKRGLSQWELSRLSGLTRSYLSRLELDDFKNPSAEVFLALARSLKIQPNDLYRAAGYIQENTHFRRKLARTEEEVFSDLEQKQFVPVPVLVENDACSDNSLTTPPQYSSELESLNILGIVARGFNLEPEIREGDILFIDPEHKPDPGQIVLCYQDGKARLTRYPDEPDGNGNLHPLDGLHIYGIVIAINRRL